MPREKMRRVTTVYKQKDGKGRKAVLTPEDKLFCDLIMQGVDRAEAYIEAFKPTDNPDQTTIMRRSYKILNKDLCKVYMGQMKLDESTVCEDNGLPLVNEVFREEVQRVCREKAKTYEDLIVSEHMVLTFWLDIMNSTSRSISITNRLRASENIAKFLGMDKPDTKSDSGNEITININNDSSGEEDDE